MAWKLWLKKLMTQHRAEGTDPLPDLPEEFGAAWQLACRTTGLDDIQFAAIAAEFNGVPQANLDQTDAAVLRYVAEPYAHAHAILPLRLVDGRLHLACADPADDEVAKHVGFACGHPVDLFFATPDRIEERITLAYARRAEIAAGQVLSLSSKEAGFVGNSIVLMANLLLTKAVELGASDIHLQPHFGGSIARMRVDGLLRRVMTMPKEVGEYVIRHFLAVSGMDPTTLHLPQDGRYQMSVDGRRFDLRLSMLPSRGGHTLVIRLRVQSRSFSLTQLGLSVADRNCMQRHVGQMSGIVLLTGPTGCGKTTTLYALLAGLNRPEISIATVEDPVEYEMPGLAQTEVNEKRGLGFDLAIRSLMRQDPNVLLIGEIRDSASAHAAARAALTGHLVLATLHTNSAQSAIPRLMDLGLSEQILGEVIVAVAAQRLVRQLCVHCAEAVEKPLRGNEETLLELTDELPAKRAKGCEKCGYSGYRGRLPIVEIYEPTAEERLSLMQGSYASRGPNEADRRRDTLPRSAFEMAISGITTLEECERVLGFGFWHGIAHMANRPLPAVSLSSSLFGEDQEARVGLLLIGLHDAAGLAIRDALKAEGYAVHEVDTPQAASEFLHRNQNIYAMVVNFDSGDDEGVCRLLAARQSLAWAGLPAVTLIPPNEHRLHAIFAEHLTNYFLEKPAAPEDVVKRVKAVLG